MKEYKPILNVPLAAPVLALASGIAAGNFFPLYFLYVFTPSALIALLLLHCSRKIDFLNLVFFILFFITGFLLIMPCLPGADKHKPIAQYSGTEKFRIVAQVDSRPQTDDIRTKTILKIQKIKAAGKTGEWQNISGRIILYSYHKTPQFQYGDLISFTGAIKQPGNFSNPGGFNYIKYLSFNDIQGVSYINGENIVICSGGKGFHGRHGFLTRVVRKIHGLRHRFVEFAKGFTDNSKVFSILCALTTGIKDYIPNTLAESFSKAGVSHILAISGLHLSIVALIFFHVFNYLLSWVKALAIRGVQGRAAAVLTIIPLFSYAVLSGFSPSTRRAFIMIVVYMLSLVIKREKDVLNSLAAAGIIILIPEPAALFSISFQLSFSAVLFIILGLNAADNVAFLQTRTLAAKFLMLIMISVAAGLGTMPLVMHYFNTISFVQVFANLVIIPVMGFIVVPLGLAAFFIFSISTTIASILIKLLIPFLSFSVSFIEHISSNPYTFAKCVTPHGFEIICYYMFMLGIFSFLFKHKKKGACMVVCSSIMFSCYTGFQLKHRFFSGDLQITVLDVGQGSSALIEGPGSTRILVDGGGFSGSSSFDTGRYIVAPFLWNRKIATLDAVILTHPETDHMKGLIYIINNFTVKKFIKNFDSRKKRSYFNLINACLGKDVPVIIPTDRQVIEMGDLKILFFYPFHGDKSLEKSAEKDYNNNSIVFKLIYKNFTTLFPGDIMEKTEKKIATAFGSSLKSNVMIAPHHGSATSSTSLFLDKVSPASIIISCGFHNKYNFPHKSVVARYNTRGIKYFRTDLMGAVKIISNGESCDILTFKGD